MPVASLSWVPSPTLPYLLPRHSFRPLLSHLYPASSPISDQFPCPRLGPNGGIRQPLAGRSDRKPSQSSSSCGSGVADGKEIKKWSTRNEDGDNTHDGGVLLLTAAAQILNPHYPRAPQKQSSISPKKRVARAYDFSQCVYSPFHPGRLL